MARFQLNDEVLVEGNNNNQYRARITEIVFDGFDTDESEYLVIDEHDDFYEIADGQILGRISIGDSSRPAFTSNNTFSFDPAAESNLGFDVDTPPEPSPDPQPFGNTLTVSELENSMREFTHTTYAAYNGDLARDIRMMWGTALPQTNPIREEHLTIEQAATLAERREQFVRRINRDADDGVHATKAEVVEPPIPHNEGRSTISSSDGRPTVASYKPAFGGIGDLMSFRAHSSSYNMIFTPTLVGREYHFIDEATGMRWINQYENGHVRNVPTLLDENAVRWSDVRTVIGTNTTGSFTLDLGKKVGKSKKKLYRKHPIPEIKDEKHYASNEFIA